MRSNEEEIQMDEEEHTWDPVEQRFDWTRRGETETQMKMMILHNQMHTRIQERAEVHARHSRAKSHHHATGVEDATTNQMLCHAKPDPRYSELKIEMAVKT